MPAEPIEPPPVAEEQPVAIVEDVIPVAEAQPEEVPVPADEEVVTLAAEAEIVTETAEPATDNFITPVFAQDYFLHTGEKIPDELTFEPAELQQHSNEQTDRDKALMVMMSFTEWLLHFKHTSEREKEETRDQKALKTMWQKEKLAAALEEENEEIPENVFEMAVNSISKEDGVVSETLADIYIKQGKYDQAIDMYRKLSLRNPQKNAYFAHKIEEALKNKQL
jgi:hypothetical protein